MGCGIEPRKIIHRRGREFLLARRQHVRHRYARCCRPAGVEGHITCKGIASEPGRSRVWPSLWRAACRVRRSASGRREAVADDARAREVALRHSSCEADEQRGAIRCGAIRGGANRRGAGGAKGGDQGECGLAKHVRAEPGKRVTSAGSHTAIPCRLDPRWEPYAGKPHVRLCAGGAR